MSSFLFMKTDENTLLVTETNMAGTFRQYTLAGEQIGQAILDSKACIDSRKTKEFCNCFACQLTKFVYEDAR
jgi:hypothetical protein